MDDTAEDLGRAQSDPVPVEVVAPVVPVAALRAGPVMRRRRRVPLQRTVLACAVSGAALGLTTCSPHWSTLERVQALHVLRVASINSPTTCYQTAGGESGYECDLLKGLARVEHLSLHIQFFDSAQEVERAVAFGQADLGAAALRIPAEPANGTLQFTSPIGSVAQQLVYGRAGKRLRDLAELDAPVEIAAQGGTAALLPQLREQSGAIRAQVVADAGPEDLLYQVAQGRIAYTICDSTLVALNQHYYPQLNVAFDVAPRRSIGWVIPDDGPEFSERIEHYFDTVGAAQMERAFDRYFSPRDESDHLGLVRFSADVQERLPGFRDHFQRAAQETGVDWRLLAAISYQESHWDPLAVSPTGVRGMMMLTSATAQYLDVANRVNVGESIGGGSRYFSELLETLPPAIEGRDRVDMALAAYNMGLGHVLDIRKIVVREGGNPDQWRDVSRALPLLMQERWYEQTDFGYARSHEALHFVANVENYYDILSWLTGGPAAVITAPTQPQARLSGGAPGHVKS